MSEGSAARPAVFLDRDGTLIQETHFLTNPDDLHILPGARKALRLIKRAGLLAVVITNQSAIARGLLSEAGLSGLHRRLASLFEIAGSQIDAFYYCPHHPDIDSATYGRSCECRKPKPGLLYQAAEDLNLDLKRSVMVGDRLRDVEAGWRAGCFSILVRTGYGAAEEAQLLACSESDASSPPPDLVCDDILSSVPTILEMTRERKP